jgi:Mycolic acid cyclopropane synthetase
LTLSIEQKNLAEERIKGTGLENQIRVHLLDYREIPAEFEKAFDAFVSVEILEVSSYICLSYPVSNRDPLSMSERNITTSTSNLLTLLSNLKMRRLLSLHPLSIKIFKLSVS